MKLKDLSPNPENPRTITEQKQRMLAKALKRFGDLSGIVYNRKTNHLVGGHQRRDALDQDSVITITKKNSRPTKTGTVAEGYVEIGTDRFSYREVYWDDHTEKAANIAANKGAGDWDPAKLKEWMTELTSFDLFDSDFNLDLTMFDQEETKELIGIEVSAHTRKTSSSEEHEEELLDPPKCKQNQIYKLGESVQLKCAGSDDDLRFCDWVMDKWRRRTGLEPIAVRTETKTRKAAKPALNSHA